MIKNNESPEGIYPDPVHEDITVKGPVSMTLYASTTERTPSDWAFFIKIGETCQDGQALNPVTGSVCR